MDEETQKNKTGTKRFGFGIRHVQMLLMATALMVCYIAQNSISVAVLAMTDHTKKNKSNIVIFDWDKKTQGVVLSSFYWGGLVVQIPAGVFASKFGGKVLFFSALMINGITCLIIPLFVEMGGWPLVCIARVVMGLSQASVYPSTHTLLGKWLPPSEQTTYIGLVYGGCQIGTVISMPLAGLLAETALGWKLIYYTIAGLLLVVAILWYFFTASSPRDHRMISNDERNYIEKELNSSKLNKSTKTPWGQILTTKETWALIAAHTATIISYTFYCVDMPTYLEKALKISLKDSSLLSAIPFISMWAGSVIFTSLSDKILNAGLVSRQACRKIFNTLGIFSVAAGLLIVAFLGIEHKVVILIILILCLGLSGSISAGFMASYLDISPNFCGVLLGVSGTAANILCMLIPIGNGYILRNDPTNLSRWKISFLILSAASVALNLVYLALVSDKKQPWDNPESQDKDIVDIKEVHECLLSEMEKSKMELK